ncbi:uncharacterized protein [Diadema antillarum]|uniref:uncharacterized protein n=1 Tax=Diadema antillarum TaxID=105358 RepID=UPI003A842939
MRTCPMAGKYVLSKKIYRCHHGQQRKAKEGTTRHSKDTGCCAKLTISVRRSVPSSGRKSRNSDPHLELLPTLVTISWEHNHAISIPAALKFRDVSADTCHKLEDLYRRGHSPASALNVLELDLQDESPEEYILNSADRALCPDLKFCYRLYYKIFQRAYGSTDGADMLTFLEEQVINNYNSEAGMICAKIKKTSNQEVIIAICTPMMQRVHSMVGHSSELVFIDSTGNVDRHGSRIFLLLTHSSSGGLPLGVIITSNEQEQTITEGLELLKTILPTDAFGGNGNEGPAVFITDDCLSERKALHTVFPKSTLLLCTFHLLQSVWRWLWDSKHGINKDHRQSLFLYVKQMMYATDPHAVEAAYQRARSDPTVVRYHGYGAYLESLYERRQVWAQAFRLGLRIRANNTNNYAEAAMRVLKDSILQRSKAFNVPQLVDFILCRLESFYQRRLLAVVNQRPLKWKIQPHRGSTISKDDIFKTGESTYQVTSQSDRLCRYTVDMAVGVCSCHEGVTGGACKHQEAIVRHFDVASSNFLPTSATERTLLLQIATGCDDNVPSGWLDPLQTSESMAEDGPEPEQHGTLPATGHSEIQDPQLVRVESLRAQGDLLNAFDKRLHGNVSSISDSRCKYSFLFFITWL